MSSGLVKPLSLLSSFHGRHHRLDPGRSDLSHSLAILSLPLTAVQARSASPWHMRLLGPLSRQTLPHAFVLCRSCF